MLVQIPMKICHVKLTSIHKIKSQGTADMSHSWRKFYRPKAYGGGGVVRTTAPIGLRPNSVNAYMLFLVLIFTFLNLKVSDAGVYDPHGAPLHVDQVFKII